MLYFLTYLSVAREPFSEAALARLLVLSRERNTSLGLSGMLLHRNGTFIQALEGEQERVEALYSRISVDPRHHQLQRLASGPIERRAFAGWSMGFQNLSEDPPTGFSPFLSSTLSEKDLGSARAEAQRLLMRFKDAR